MTAHRPAPDGRNVCPHCGTEFICGMQTGQERCWCSALPPQVPDPAVTGCLCPGCLNALIAQRQAPASG